MTKTRWFTPAVACLLWLGGFTQPAGAYEVEANSAGNTVFILVWNHQPSATFDSIAVGETLPGFVTQASATLVPASVPANQSDLAAVEFDVGAAAAGSTGDLTLVVSGSAGGQPIDVVLTVPLEVVTVAPEAQGLVGEGIPAPDPGGADSDSDGITDALEIAFGSDPNDPLSTPGTTLTAVPALQALGLAGLAALLVLGATRLARRHPPAQARP
ncbi:MAG: thrombospondin type 3 repeat-containing protein [Myxococcota bacterium]|nr:thrombospondin type 3 repeat-containing protein [Myxococcota bacterium]